MKDVIEQFIVQYQNEFEYYYQTSKICAHQLENKLESSGIRAMITFRAKRADRLEDKLRKRNLEKNYKTFEDINKDIVDLAGVRIAFYFPADMQEIDKIICNQFHILKSKEFPKIGVPNNKKTFIGYKAKHYRINFDPQKLSAKEKRFSHALVEIQVASILMHSWAEVEHDLVYKPLSGELSEDELGILDELNGLVLTGEIALDGLQRAFRRRMVNEDNQFNNHFELAAYIYQVIKSGKQKSVFENVIGNVDVLYSFIHLINFNYRKKIKEYVSKVVLNPKQEPISNQIIDLVLMEHPEFNTDFDKVKTKFISKK
jgi:ppGpp synthetase/RelA/SpoT-type nucleotidyltranferase